MLNLSLAFEKQYFNIAHDKYILDQILPIMARYDTIIGQILYSCVAVVAAALYAANAVNVLTCMTNFDQNCFFHTI